MSENVIELNGKRYDAITGAYLGMSHIAAVPAAPPMRGKVVDGFIRPPHKSAHTKTTPQIGPKPAPSGVSLHPTTIPTPTTRVARRRPAAPRVIAHKPERAKTLMRTTVHKPEPRKSSIAKLQAPAEITAKPASALARKHSVTQVDPKRLARAQETPKHHAVAHFRTPGYGVQPEHHIAVNVKKRIPMIPVRSAPTIAHTVQPAHTDMFEAAMHRATSHQEPAHKHRKHHRLINTFAGIAVFFIIGGFVAYLNIPSIELHFASAQAGFHASMPGYAPTGYALSGRIKHAGGTISMRFTSGDSSYTITQQASNWSSQTLLDNTLALSGAHQTIQKNGETIYVYGDGASAAWVSGGVRYDMAGNASLNSNEIVAIATSL